MEQQKQVDPDRIASGPDEAYNTAIETDDPWIHRSTRMKCGGCMYYTNFRCRRHAPTMQGYPAVYPGTDWCGDHKLDKKDMGGI